MRTSRAGRAAGLLAAGAGALVLAACGGSDSDGPIDPAKNVPIGEAIAAAGGGCEESGALGRQNCTVDGISFQLVKAGWERQAGQRERECDAGYVSRSASVLTDGSWVVFTDDDAQSGRLASVLAEHGVRSEIRGYCDFMSQ